MSFRYVLYTVGTLVVDALDISSIDYSVLGGEGVSKDTTCGILGPLRRFESSSLEYMI